MEILFAVVLLLICGAICFLITYWWLILLMVGFIVVVILITRSVYLKNLDKITLATIISRTPIIETIREKTGCSRSYGYRYTYTEHFCDRDVLTGYNVTFFVTYENGRKNRITCKEGSATYKKLINKVKK